jgi:hypothetical protein
MPTIRNGSRATDALTVSLGGESTALPSRPQALAQREKPQPFALVKLQEVVGEPRKLKGGVTRITVQIDKQIPNDTGWIVFPDQKIAEFGEYNPPGKAERLLFTNRLTLYLDPEVAPMKMTTAEQFRQRLRDLRPVPVYLRHHQPAPAKPARQGGPAGRRTQLLRMQKISVEYSLRMPQTIWATDDTTDPTKYTTGDDLDPAVLAEICAKLQKYHTHGGDIRLTIESSRFIIKTP